ncbi:MAG: hypothetical protein RDV48_13550 [Candidatus Eremiobacteraeota bacterium]|nr:hypothetical protein [Candidatus Eremiobacteraeota bacterium]
MTTPSSADLIAFDESRPHLEKVTAGMTPQQMREYYLYQTRKSMEAWEKANFPIMSAPPFDLGNSAPLTFFMSPDHARKIGLRKQVEEFARESQVSTAGVRENQNVICPWDHRYRINEYIFALIAEALSRMVKEHHAERMKALPLVDEATVAGRLGEENVKIIESIFGMKLAGIMEFVRKNPVRIVGGEVRSNTPRFVDLVSRIYAANDLYVFLMKDVENRDTSSIFMWSFLIFILGLSGGDFFTSSHGAPQKQSDKILSFDGSQYLPEHYVMIVEHMWHIMETIEREGYTFRLAAKNDSHFMRRLDYESTAMLYVNYLKAGPASPHAISMIKEAEAQGLRLMLDFFGGAGYRTISSILKALGVFDIFKGGLIRTEEDPFFQNIGFVVAPKKNMPEVLEVIHLSVDASLPQVVETAGYGSILKDAPAGQVIFNVDPDVDRFVGGQVVPAAEKPSLDRLGITSVPLSSDSLFALYSPNQLFLMIADNDMIQAKDDGWWGDYSNFDIHTYVSALSWDEWADCNKVPVLRVPVGFKEIAAIERSVESGLKAHPGGGFAVRNELGEEITLGANPKLHHAGEESGGKIGGPRVPIYNVNGEFVIAMREKSSGEACFSAIALQSRLYLEGRKAGKTIYFHDLLQEIFSRNAIVNTMEFRGDIIHYNEAIIDPGELARAKAEGLAGRNRFNEFFRHAALAYKSGAQAPGGKPISLQELREILSEAIPAMREEWSHLEKIDVWSDGLQMWFSKGRAVRDICLRPSGTDAKSKVYFDGTDKELLRKYFAGGFQKFGGEKTPLYTKLIEP